MSNGYNGWTNYETWAFNLWEGDVMQESLQDLVNDGQFLTFGEVHDFVEGHIDLLLEETHVEGMFSDFLGHAIQQINTHEIAEHLEEGLNYEVIGVYQPGIEVYEFLHVDEDEAVVRYEGEIETADVEWDTDEADFEEEPRPYVELGDGTWIYLDEVLNVGSPWLPEWEGSDA